MSLRFTRRPEDGVVPDLPPTSSGPGDLGRGLASTARPRQWAKNVLVFAAPGAAGVLTTTKGIVAASVAFVVFCLAASGTYFVNDSFDAQADRLHERKRHRAVAAGIVSVRLARITGGALMLASLTVALVGSGRGLALLTGLYLALTFSYSAWLKRVPVLDLAAVAGGFILRAIAGGVAAGVPISQWFLIVASFGSLFLVAGKREGEHLDLGDTRGRHRATLDVYSASYLRYVRSTSSAVAIAAYCLWAFEKAQAVGQPLWFELSIIPFVLAILSYALRVETGAGSEPTEVLLADRTIQALGLAWVVLFAVGVYGR